MSDPRLRIVAISSLGAVHQYVLSELSKTHPLAAVVRTFPMAGPQGNGLPKKRPLRRLPKLMVNKIHHDLMAPVYRRREQTFSRELFGQNPPPPFKASHEIGDGFINEESSRSQIAALNPDVLVVCGAPLLKQNIFSTARFGTINIHYGISPNYRGEHTLFWPLMKGEDDLLGVTIHYVDQGVDSGAVIAQGFPELSRSDREADLWIKCARLAVRLLQEILAGMETRKIGARMQDMSIGRSIRFRKRRFYHELWQWSRRNILRRMPAPRAERIERFF